MSDFENLDPETTRLRERLKQAVRTDVASEHLHERIRSGIRGGPRALLQPAWLAAAAAIVITLGIGAAYQFGYLRLTPGSRESYITSVTNRVAAIMSVGLGDHVECAVFRKYPKNPPPVQQIVEQMVPEYRDLVSIVRSRVPQEYQLFMAHQCGYHGRKFTHLILRKGSRTLSVVIAQKDWGDSFMKADLAPVLAQSGIPIYRAGVQRFQIAAFETSGHLVYFISDLPEQQNTDLMLALAPGVKEFLQRFDSKG
jgi:hypothetical protein